MTARATFLNAFCPPGPPVGSFPLAARYRALLPAPARGPAALREAPADFHTTAFTERHLQCVWYDNRLRPPVTTSDGEHVTVLSPGRWNLEAGPDFLDAVLVVGPEQRRIAGDVEVHIHPSDWTAHGHAADERYRRLVAHVTFHDTPSMPPGMPAGAIRIALRDALKRQSAFAFDLIDVTAYPYAARPPGRPPCAVCLAGRPPDAWLGILESAGQERILRKTLRLAERCAEVGAEQALYEDVLTALGYKHNRAACLTLARLAPAAELSARCGGAPLRAYAALMGVAGLLPDRLVAAWPADARAFVRSLWDVWWKLPANWHARAMARGAWRLGGQRPHNHPARRLAAAAVLFADAPLLAERLRAVPTDPAVWFASAATLLERDAALPFWGRRLSLAGPSGARVTALIGAARAAAIVANVFVPWAAAAGRDVNPLLAALPAEEDNAVIRETAYLLFGPDHNPALYRQGIRQQGLMQIFHDHCLRRKPGCEQCGLAAALGAG